MEWRFKMVGCSQCGTCCLYVEVKMRHNSFDKPWVDFLKVTRPDVFIFTNEGRNMKIVSPCIHLDRETNTCNIYSSRPDTCREYTCRVEN